MRDESRPFQSPNAKTKQWLVLRGKQGGGKGLLKVNDGVIRCVEWGGRGEINHGEVPRGVSRMTVSNGEREREIEGDEGS